MGDRVQQSVSPENMISEVVVDQKKAELPHEMRESVTEQKDEVADFLQRHAAAQALGEHSIEAPESVIRRFQPRGLNGEKYFTYGDPGVRVYLLGTMEAHLREEAIPHNKRNRLFDGEVMGSRE